MNRPRTGEPFGLPRGSIRSILAILLVTAAICLAFAGRLDANQGFLTLVTAAVVFYFSGRQSTPPAPTPPTGITVTPGEPQ